MKNKIATLILVIFTCAFLNAQVKVAKIDRSLWPENLNSEENFDYASKMQILVYAKCLIEIQNLNDVDQIKAKYNIKSANLNSFSTWKKEQMQLVLQNLHAIKSQTILDKTVAINKSCTWQDVVKTTETLDKTIPTNLNLWYLNALDFSRQYVNELARLAFLFPKTSSEILTFAPNEITGSNYADKEFLLTFDDGPTKENGNTDKLIATLNELNINGMFFVLGEQLQNRINTTSIEKLNHLYATNNLQSHGKIHKSHQYLETWQESIDYTFSKIKTVTNTKNERQYFRPPYGQRTEKVSNYLSSKKASVMLWNIDSQDWSSKINASEVSDRVITLMLLWRKGIILFHDIHPKAKEALPVITKTLNKSGVQFIDARKL